MDVQLNKQDIQARKITFVQEFLRLQNEDIISGLEKMLKKYKAELYESKLDPMTLEQFNREIDEALNDSKYNRVIKADELKSKFEKWRS
jgi:hypothetical protein